jgi:hypothetical protein
MNRDWKEAWVDQMGLIVALSGANRFDLLNQFKAAMMSRLSSEQRDELVECLRQRFTPSSIWSKLPKEP